MKFNQEVHFVIRTLTCRREKNRVAARKCRTKKTSMMSTIEQEVSQALQLSTSIRSVASQKPRLHSPPAPFQISPFKTYKLRRALPSSLHNSLELVRAGRVTTPQSLLLCAGLSSQCSWKVHALSATPGTYVVSVKKKGT